MRNKDIVLIGDTQVRDGDSNPHLRALSRYLWENKPETVVHIGDHFDFPSLSTYLKNDELNDHKLFNDLRAGEEALQDINSYIDERNKLGKRPPYVPNKYVCLGNHENRLERLVQNHPYLEGLVDYRAIFRNYGWEVKEFLEPLYINEILFRHYLTNPESGRPVGGSIENKLNKTPTSFCHGHQQKYQYGRRQNLQGKPHFGICCGSFYLHDEGYRGYDNTEQRGFVHLRAFTNRYGYLDYDPVFISVERLIEEYGE